MVLAESDLVSQIGNIGISADSEVLFYASEVLPSATRAWWILYYAGHNNIRILNGGLAAWEKAGGKTVEGSSQYEPAKFEGSFRQSLFSSKEEVLAAMEDSKVSTEYTLPLRSYGGVYIPGSSFNSAMGLMHNMSTFLSDEEIIPLMREGGEHERIITYCGGGIAATVNGIAHLIAGNENVSVYDGSLGEWMGEGLPIEKDETE